MTGYVLDAGAFIALERNKRVAASFWNLARRDASPLVTSAAVVGQVWRASARQVAVALALKWKNLEVLDLTFADGRRIGRLLAAAGATDVVDAHIALLARRRGWSVVTSDPDDLRRIDPQLVLHVV